jgi:uncharacterized protein YkwD
LEGLETRQVLSTVVGPTPDQQYALQLLNFVRTNPSAAAQMFVKDITPDVQDTLNYYGLTAADLVNELDSATPQPALAWNNALASTAQYQSQYEANNGTQTHQGPGEASLGDRIAAAGYTNASSFGENTYAWADDADEAMLSFLFDWGVSDHGHFDNIMQPGTSAQNAYKDVGIGLVNTTNQGLGPVVVTQDFGSQANEGPQILGVVYNDPNNTKFYAPGEGQGGVTINAVNQNTGQVYQTTSTSSGGFELPVATNSLYKVTETINGQVVSSQSVNVEGTNVEVDFDNNPANESSPTPPAPTPAPTPVPVPSTPTPAPATPTTSTPTTVSTPEPQFLVAIPPQQDSTSTTTGNNASTPTWLSGWSRWTA